MSVPPRAQLFFLRYGNVAPTTRHLFFFVDDVVYRRNSATMIRAAVGAGIAGFLIFLLVILFLWRVRKAGGISNMKLMAREEDRAIPLNPFTAEPSRRGNLDQNNNLPYSAMMTAASKANLPNYASRTADPNLGSSSRIQLLTTGGTPPDDQVAAPSRLPPGKRPRPSARIQRQSLVSVLSPAPSYRTIDGLPPGL